MKAKRDITLGEMQDECKKHEASIIDACGDCPHRSWCGGNSPNGWNLTDPPRFNDAQMAFFRWWYGIGARKAVNSNSYEYGAITVFEDVNKRQIGNAQEFSIIKAVKENGNELDLAELLGEDGK